MAKSYSTALLAVTLAILMVSSPVAAVTATGGGIAGPGTSQQVDGAGNTPTPTEGSTTSTDTTNNTDTATTSTVDSDQTAKESLSAGVQARLDNTGSSERIPVLIVFKQQPDDQLPLQSMSGSQARTEMKSLAADTQAPVLDTLETETARGNAADVSSLYLTNAIAVEANEKVVTRLAGNPNVDKIVLDSKVSAFDNTNNEDDLNRSVKPSGFERVTSGDRADSIEEIGADSVHESGITGEGVNVSVIDTGIDDDHPALEGQVVLREDFTNSTANGTDPNGHGTHVAGTIAGRPDAQRAVGVAPGVNLFDARVLDEYGSGKASDVIEAFQWSANNSADVASASLGFSPVPDPNTNASVPIEAKSSYEESFDVAESANGAFTNNTSVGESSLPAYVYVKVDGVSASEAQNLSLTLENPSGTESLERYEAGFRYSDGTVPEDELLYKYKPSTTRTLENGTWTLNVTNENNVTVTPDVKTEPVYVPDGTDQVARAVNNLNETGTIPVVAAGNDGYYGNQTVGSPAVADHAIAVGAHQDDSIDVTSFSSRGPVGFGTDRRPGVDLIAPGQDVISAGSTDAYPNAGDEPYYRSSGTSMAAPHVSGTIALMLDADASQSKSEVETTIESTAQDVPRGSNAAGAGALDAYAAVNRTVSGELNTNQTESGFRDLYAGLGQTGDESVYVELDPITDPVGDAGSAPDFEEAYVDVDDYNAEFEYGLADDTAPNATFVTYIDADQNDTTGDLEASGAEYRVNLTRTFTNGTYSATAQAHAYNASAGQYEPVDIGAYANDGRPEYVEFDIDTQGYTSIETTTFDWYTVAHDSDSTDTDRLPDTDSLDTGRNYTVDVPGTAVVWNSTAGAPEANATVEFRLYDQYNRSVELTDDQTASHRDRTLLGNRTVQTNALGEAKTTFTVEGAESTDFELEIEDDRGNQVTQNYDVSDPYIDRGPSAGSGGQSTGLTVESRDYEVRANESVTLNIPVYNETSGEITPYNGPASIQLDNQENIDNLTVDDGVLTVSVDTSAYPSLDNDYGWDVEVGLDSNFSASTTRFDGGYIDIRDDVTYDTSVVPVTQVTSPQTPTNVTYQTVKEEYATGGSYQQSTPGNTTADYQTAWITDRVVASFYSDLPDSVATKIQRNRRTDGQPDELTRSERQEVREAIENISTQTTMSVTQTGQVDPQQRGVGQFQVTPPEDARLGFVQVETNTSQVSEPNAYADSDTSTVYVGKRVDEFDREPTAPEETERYDIDVYADWESNYSSDVVVPEDTIQVEVSLEDIESDRPVDNTDVYLYSTTGETQVVTTNADGVATANVSAPDVDWVNASRSYREQDIVAVASGLQAADGRALSDEDTAYAYVDDQTDEGSDSIDEDAYADPSLSYDSANETLDLDVEYRNATTYELTNASTTLVTVGTPDSDYGIQRDVFVGYIGRNTDATSVSRKINESAGLTTSPREYEADSRIAGQDFAYSDSEYLGGIRTSIETESYRIEAGSSTNATVTLTDRNGDPVTNATTVLHYAESREGASAGDALVGMTDANGTATFELTPDLADKYDQGTLRLSASYATDNVARHDVGFDSLQVVSSANITGTVQEPDGSAASGTVAAQSNGGDNPTRVEAPTNQTGAFELTVPQGANYGVGYIENTDGENGVPDLYRFAKTGTVGSDVDLGTNTLPTGHNVTVQVVDNTSVPVQDARVEVVSYGTGRFGSQGVSSGTLTNDRGYITPVGDGVELSGNVEIAVQPPEGDDTYINDVYTKQVNVTGDRNVTVALDTRSDGTEDTTPPTVEVAAPEEVVKNESFTVDASGSYDRSGIANYTFELPDGETFTQSSATAEVSLSEPGVQNITVTATDKAGNSASETVAVTVIEGRDLETTVSVADEQRLSGVTSANVTVEEIADTRYNSTFNVSVTISNGTVTETQNYSVNGLDASASDTRTINMTEFVQSNRVTGPVTVEAAAAQNTNVTELDTSNNVDAATTEITYVDLRTSLRVPDTNIKGSNVSYYVIVRNRGTATSDSTSVDLTETTNATESVNASTVAVSSLQPGAVNTTKQTVTAANMTINATVYDGRFFPDNNATSTGLSVRPYDLTVDYVNAPASVEEGSTFYVTSRVDANVPDDVNVTIATPDSVSVQRPAASRDVYVSGSRYVSWRVNADSTASAEQINVTAAANGKNDSQSDLVEIESPKVRVSDQNSATLRNNSTESMTVEIRNETTYEHELQFNVQAGADGRTLKGLDYLVDYPYGCVEQTTSPMLTALNTDQYYRNTTVDYDQQKVNNSVAGGMERLEKGGDIGQHDNGAWSMYGNDPSGDLFYTVYALYGTSEVANDPVQGTRSDVQNSTNMTNKTAAVEWLSSKQSDDGSFESNWYYEDRRSMTGLTLVSLDQADQASVNNTTVNPIRGDAVQYLLETQNSADGSWNAEDGESSTMATALAVRGLATTTDENISGVNDTAVQQAIDNGTTYLHKNQKGDGSWEGYHDQWSYASQGSISESTAHALIALDATGVSDQNATVQAGHSYLETVYEKDGSWGYTRATAISIEALQTVDSETATSQNVTITISNGTQDLYTTTAQVNSSSDSLKTISLSGVNNQTLADIRDTDQTEYEVTVKTDGEGLVITSVENDQLINENEYEANGGN